MKNNNLALTIGATTLITLGALGLAFAGDNHSYGKGESVLVDEDGYPIRNIYSEIIKLETSTVGYYNVVETAKKKAEEREQERLRLLEEQRLLEEKRKQEEELKRKKAEEAKNDLGTFNTTFYTPFCDSGCTGKTATGIDVSKSIKYQGLGVVATDWSLVPPYSIIEIEGLGQYIVLDRGSAIRGKKLDVLVSSTAEAYKLGRQYLNVKVIRWGEGK